MMRILQVHNHYQQTGGEDTVVAAEKSLLEENGQEVITYRRHNDDINSLNSFRLALVTHWNPRTIQDINRIIDEHHPDIVHCHNTFPLISPSVFFSCNRRGIPVVQTLHNYRIFCANGYLLKRSNVCEHCLRHPFSPLPAFWHCYRKSFTATMVQLTLRWTNRFLNTYSKHVDSIIVLTQFAKDMLKKKHIPENKVFVKPNFIADPLSTVLNAPRSVQKIQRYVSENSPYFLFVGRLSGEKGISLLLDAWQLVKSKASLFIVGDGPLVGQVRAQSEKDIRIIYLGPRSTGTVYELMQKALAVIVPSICYEAMPTTIIEAFGNGTPVIAANHGAMAEMVDDNKTGFLFEPGNSQKLSICILKACSERSQMTTMSSMARQVYLDKYAPKKNYERLIDIYCHADHFGASTISCKDDAL